MTENQKYALFMVVWIGSALATLKWILWKIERDDTDE